MTDWDISGFGAGVQTLTAMALRVLPVGRG
jgi:hypothetical protein